jgi:hypothetical protein
MRCFPFADPNEVSHSIASGAVLAAQLAAGIEPSPEAITSLAQPRRNTAATTTANAMTNNMDANGAGCMFPLGIATSSPPSSSSPAASTLPPRPDTRLARRGLALPSVSIHSNPDLLQRRMMSSQERYQGKQDQLEDVLLQSLSLRGGLSLPSLTSSTSPSFPSSSQSNNKCNKSPALLTGSPKPNSTSGSFLSPMAAPYIARSPSMPTLASYGAGGLLAPNHQNHQNIWKSSTPGNGKRASDLSPLASIHPFTPSTYQSYTPTTVFASTPPPSNTNTEVRNGGSSSTSLGPNLGLSNDIWSYNNHLGIGFGSSNNNHNVNNNSSSRSSNSNSTSPSTVGLYSSLLQDSPIIDGIPSWLEVESSSLLPSTPFSGSSSSSTIKASKCNRSPPIIDDFPGQ